MYVLIYVGIDFCTPEDFTVKLRNLLLYACAFCLTFFMLHRISQYNAQATEAISSSDRDFVDVSEYIEEDALLAFASASNEKVAEAKQTKFFYPMSGGKFIAFTDGTVTQIADGVIVITHNEELATRYSGCIHRQIIENEKVSAGRILADMDENAHFEVLFRGEAVEDVSLYLALTFRS